MNSNNENRYMVDILFVLTLFCVFALCSILLIAVGTKVYQNTVDDMATHFTSATSLSYITEKIRQNDESGRIDIQTFGDTDSLVFLSEYNGSQYYTYIYSYSGYLKELFAPCDIALTPEAGRNILKISEFNITELKDGLYEITLVDDQHRYETIVISQKTD